MSETWRLFVALELPPSVLTALSRIQANMARSIPGRALRYVRPEGIHLTLKFLGDTPVTQVDALIGGIGQAAKGQSAFDLMLGEAGCFPNMEQPRVVWLGLEGDLARLRALQNAVEGHMAVLGFPPEARDFSPHLTLARSARSVQRDDRVAIKRAVQGYRPPEAATGWGVETLSLVRSLLKPEGAVYTQVAAVPLE